jgi:hypothetical protein
MYEKSTVTLADDGKRENGYRLDFDLAMEDGQNRRHTFPFTYELENPPLFFIELLGKKQNIVLRMSNQDADRKSYDMFKLFSIDRDTFTSRKWVNRIFYKKSFLASDWERFDGFSVLGFTLIQPPWRGIASELNYSVHLNEKVDSDILSLVIHNHTFKEVKIYDGLVNRKPLSWRTFSIDDED